MYGRSKQITDPAAAVVSTSEAKTHLRVDVSTDDTYIDNVVSAATGYIENFVMRPLLTRYYKDTLPDFPWSFELYQGGVTSVSAVQYYDADNALQTLSTNYYTLDNADDDLRAKIYLNDGYSWPTVYDRPDAVQVTYAAGWSSASAVPDDLKQSVLLMVGQLYEQREDIGGRRNTVPTLAQRLAMPYRTFER